MASMRVHELAKEFNMSSKDMLDKLHEMKITAKSHASMLAESDVEKVRQNLSPEIKERAGELPAEEAKQLAEERAEAKRQQAEAVARPLSRSARPARPSAPSAPRRAALQPSPPRSRRQRR